jgi:ferredoxin-type protein NapH
MGYQSGGERMKTARRITKFLFLFLVNIGILGVTFRKLVLPFIFSSSFPFSSFTDPLHIIQESVILRILPLFALGTLLVVYAVVGKFFCGWACPFGTFQDVLLRMRLEPPQIIHTIALSLKYVILILMVALAFFAGRPLFSLLAPPETLFASIPHMVAYGIYINMATVVRYVLFFGLIFTFIFIPRFYCRYLCPVAALASPLSKFSLLTLTVSEKCDGCGECVKVCGMNIVPHLNPSSAECDKCGGCVDACPRHALRLGFYVSPERMGEEVPEGAESSEERFFAEADKRHIPKSEGSLEYIPLPLYEKSTEEVQSVLSEILFEVLSKTRPKLKYVHFGEIPEILSLIERYTEVKPEFIDAREERGLVSSLGVRHPTLFINGKVYPYTLAEEDLTFYLTEERKMGEALSLIVDTSKCAKCLTKKCKECEVFIIDNSQPYDATNVAGMGCTLCGMCMAVCPYDAITVHYGTSQTYHHTTLQHLKHNRARIEGIQPTFAEIFVRKDSSLTDKVITMVACLSHFAGGKISFLIIDADENTLKASQKDITMVPEVLLEKERSFGPPSEASLMLLLLRNDRKKIPSKSHRR